jgi:hypothetical protein
VSEAQYVKYIVNDDVQVSLYHGALSIPWFCIEK